MTMSSCAGDGFLECWIYKNMKLIFSRVSADKFTDFEVIVVDDGSKDNSVNIMKINQLLKQITDFEDVLPEVPVLELITQLENTIISENPLLDEEIDENVIIVSSAQKIIDYSINTKYQLWLDISSPEWIKSDTGPLYNAWVFQADWSKEEYTVEDDIFLSRQKTARILRKLLLLCEKHVWSCFRGQSLLRYLT